MPEELCTEVHNIVQEVVIKTIPKKRHSFILKDWNSKEVKGYPEEQASLALEYKMKQDKG